MKKTVRIDNQRYEINLHKAIKDGYIKPLSEDVELQSGDIYRSTESNYLPVLLIHAHCCEELTAEFKTWFISGFEGLHPFSNKELQSAMSETEVRKWLKSGGFQFCYNINEEIKALIKDKE